MVKTKKNYLIGFFLAIVLMVTSWTLMLFNANDLAGVGADNLGTVIADFQETNTKLYNSQTENTVGNADAKVVLKNADAGSAVDGASSPWVRYSDPTDLNKWVCYGETYPMALTYKTGIDGADDGNALSVNLIANDTNAASFKIEFDTIDASTLAEVSIKVLMNTGDLGCRLRIWSANGGECAWENTEGGIGANSWYTIKITGAELNKLLNGNTSLAAITILSQWTASSVNAGTNEAPSYILIDTISYKKIAASYNVTFDYGGKLDNKVEVLNVDPYKVKKPADPIVLGYNFKGWYKDISYAEEFNFDEGITKDVVLYAKFVEYVPAKGVVTDFSAGSIKLDNVLTGSNVDYITSPWVRYADPDDLNYWTGNLGSNFPMAFTWENEVDGANGGNALSMNLAANQTYAGSFKICFDEFKTSELQSIKLRVLMHTGDQNAKLRIFSQLGQELVTETTEGAIGQDTWWTIRLSADDIALLADGKDSLSGITIMAQWAKDVIYTGDYSNRAYILFDELTYLYVGEEELSRSVTFDYNGILDSTEVKIFDPFKVSRPTKDPTVLGYVFDDYYRDAQYSEKFDFTASVSSDVTIYAKLVPVEMKDDIVADFVLGSVVLSNAPSESQADKLSSPFVRYADSSDLNRWTGDLGANYPMTLEWKTKVEGANDGTALSVNLVNQVTNAGSFKVNFKSLSADQLDNVALALRVYMHTGSEDTRFMIYTADGNKSVWGDIEGNIGSDKWTYIFISGSSLEKLLNGSDTLDSFIVMFSYNLSFINEGSYDNPSYILLDEISVIKLYDIILDVDGVKTTVQVAEGDKISLTVAPSKEGYVFAGWSLNGEPYDVETPITSTMELKAVFEKEESDYAKCIGAYSLGGYRLLLNDDNSAFLVVNGSAIEGKYKLSVSGTIVFEYESKFDVYKINGETINVNGRDLAKVESVIVTYKWDIFTRNIYIASGDKAIDLILESRYISNGWVEESGTEVFDFNTEITKNTLLIADCVFDEIEDYSE